MNRKRIAQYCCAALVAAGVGLNIQNAIADYGIGQNSFSLVAGPGSNSGSNSNSNSSSDDWEDDMESNLGALSNSCSNSSGWWDKLLDPCYDSFATLKSEQCKESQTNASSGTNQGIHITVPIDGVPVDFGLDNNSNYNYSNTVYNGQSKQVCKGEFTTGHCDRREQTNCDGSKLTGAC